MKTKQGGFTLIELCVTVALGALVVGGVLFMAKECLNAGQSLQQIQENRIPPDPVESNRLHQAVQTTIRNVGTEYWLVNEMPTNEAQFFWLVTNVHKYTIEGKVGTNQWRWLSEQVGTKEAITSIALDVARQEGIMSPNTRFATWRIVQISP